MLSATQPTMSATSRPSSSKSIVSTTSDGGIRNTSNNNNNNVKIRLSPSCGAIATYLLLQDQSPTDIDGDMATPNTNSTDNHNPTCTSTAITTNNTSNANHASSTNTKSTTNNTNNTRLSRKRMKEAVARTIAENDARNIRRLNLLVGELQIKLQESREEVAQLKASLTECKKERDQARLALRKLQFGSTSEDNTQELLLEDEAHEMNTAAESNSNYHQVCFKPTSPRSNKQDNTETNNEYLFSTERALRLDQNMKFLKVATNVISKNEPVFSPAGTFDVVTVAQNSEQIVAQRKAMEESQLMETTPVFTPAGYATVPLDNASSCCKPRSTTNNNNAYHSNCGGRSKISYNNPTTNIRGATTGAALRATFPATVSTTNKHIKQQHHQPLSVAISTCLPPKQTSPPLPTPNSSNSNTMTRAKFFTSATF